MFGPSIGTLSLSIIKHGKEGIEGDWRVIWQRTGQQGNRFVAPLICLTSHTKYWMHVVLFGEAVILCLLQCVHFLFSTKCLMSLQANHNDLNCCCYIHV